MWTLERMMLCRTWSERCALYLEEAFQERCGASGVVRFQVVMERVGSWKLLDANARLSSQEEL